jgi:hypothetical protein
LWPGGTAAPTSPRRTGSFGSHDAFTDTTRIEANGLKPLGENLAEIAALRREDVARVRSQRFASAARRNDDWTGR